MGVEPIGNNNLHLRSTHWKERLDTSCIFVVDCVVDHVMHVIDIAGEDVAALGSDFDGFVVPPEGLEDIAAMPNLTVALSRRGVPLRVLEKILSHNALRVLDAVPAFGALAA